MNAHPGGPPCELVRDQVREVVAPEHAAAPLGILGQIVAQVTCGLGESGRIRSGRRRMGEEGIVDDPSPEIVEQDLGSHAFDKKRPLSPDQARWADREDHAPCRSSTARSLAASRAAPSDGPHTGS